MKTKVLITVKTYPTLSTKYRELVCTAGILEDGRLIRIYPIPFREMKEYAQYEKYEWVEIDLEKNRKDFRPESYKCLDHRKIRRIGKMGTNNGSWIERKKAVLKKVYEDMAFLISEAKDKNKMTSLAVFKPHKIIKFLIEPDTREWDPKKLAQFKQKSMFNDDSTFQIADKLPYKFSYVFQDRAGKTSTLQILDWEIGQLFWNCMRRHKNDEKMACTDVKRKYMEDFAKTRDLYFFLGTTKEFHFVSPNPFLIVGVFYPKIEQQKSLF